MLAKFATNGAPVGSPVTKLPQTGGLQGALSGMNVSQIQNLYNQSQNQAPAKSSLTSSGRPAGGMVGYLTSTTPQPVGTLAQIAQAIPPAQQQQQQQQAYDPQAFMMQMMAQMGAANQAQQQAMQQQMQQQSAQQQSSIQNIMNQTKANQANDIASIDSAYNQGKADIEDQQFQKWLEARQGVANRGLAGTGLASNADTRLLMSGNRNLTQLASDIAAQKTQTNNQYGNMMATLQNQYADAGNWMGKSSGNIPSGVSADMMFNMFKEILPYQFASQKDQLTHQADMAQTKANYDVDMAQMASDYNVDIKKLQFDYKKLDAEQRRAYDQMASTEQMFVAKQVQDYELEMTKLMGTDKNGNPTLDYVKMSQEIAIKQAELKIKAASAQASAQAQMASAQASIMRAQNDANGNQIKLMEAQAAAEAKGSEVQLEQLKVMATSSLADMEMYSTIMANTKDKNSATYKNALKNYQTAEARREAAWVSIDGIAQTGITAGMRAKEQKRTEPFQATASMYGDQLQNIFNKVSSPMWVK